MKIKKLHPAATIPCRATDGSAGYDLCALLTAPLCIAPGATAMIPTGIALAIPAGYGGFLFARSGLALKRGLAPGNCVGVIDSDYRGEVLVGLHNHGTQSQTIAPGERIAQLVLLGIHTPELEPVEELDETERADGGFGSTGQ